MRGARVDAAFLEIVLEHFVVLLDDLFNEGAMDFTDAENVGFSFVLVEAVDDDGAVVGGKVDRENARTPDFLQVQKQLFEVDGASNLLITIMRHRPRSLAMSIMRRVRSSTPLVASMTAQTDLTASSADMS